MRAVLPQQLQHSNIIQARTSIDQVIHATLTHAIIIEQQVQATPIRAASYCSNVRPSVKILPRDISSTWKPVEQFDAALFIKRQYSTPQPTPLPRAHQYPSNFCSRIVRASYHSNITSIQATDTQATSIHATFSSKQHLNGSAHDGNFGLVEKLTFPTPILHHTNPMQPSAYCEQRACRTIHRIA